jgi:predicted DNA-binding protein YlxM (UPF0122 family)
VKKTPDPNRYLEFYQFCKLIHFRTITDQQFKYLIWKFMGKKTNQQIARLDGRRITRQAVDDMIKRTLARIKPLLKK